MNSARTFVSLDGQWNLAHDPDNQGLSEKWFADTPGTLKSIQLPAMQAQGLAAAGCPGWLFRTFDYDDAWQGHFIVLRLEALNYPAGVWLNGTRLGSHSGGSAPGEFPVTAQVRPGSNLLALRLDIDADTAPTPCYPLDTPGHVSLAVLPKAHIASVAIQPDVRRKRIAVTVDAPEDCALHLQIEGTPYHVQGRAGELTLEFPEFESWTPETPIRYNLRTDLTAPDGSLDSTATSFGMREFTVKDDRFYLNNRPVYIKSVDYLPVYPGTLRADKLDVLLRREIELARNAGFNSLHIKRGPAPQGFLEIASELGILVFQSLPLACDAPEAATAAMLARDGNEPALIAWSIPTVEAGHDSIAEALAPALRQMDPGRLILMGAAESLPPRYIRPYRDTPEPFEDFTATPPIPVGPLARDFMRLLGDPGRMNVESGLAAPGATTWDDSSDAGAETRRQFEEAYATRQLERCFASPDKFFESSQALQADGIQTQLDAVRSNARVVGYGVHCLCDGPETLPFGLADARRQAKPALKALRQVQQEVRPVIQMQKYNLTPREEIGVTILLINESRIEGRGELSLQVVGPTNQVLWKKKRLVKIPRHGRELWSGDIAASGSPGPHRFVVRLMQDRRVIGENSVNLHVVQPVTADPVEIYVPGGRGAVRSACGKLGKLGNVLAPVHIVPPLANSIRAYPADDLLQILAQVAEGAIAIVFQPPADWNELAETVDGNLAVVSRPVVGPGVAASHYAKLHPVFDGLPSRDLMRQPYQNVLPLRAFVSDGDEEMSGVHCRFADGTHWWGANFIVRRLGAGRVVFTHLRILEHLGTDPVANRLFQNLLLHFSRRSVPATETAGADQKCLEWLNQERNTAVRKWMVLGSFPNWDGRSGHDAVLPPEKDVDFDGTYPGWYRALRWKAWWTRDINRHRIDFHEALDADVGIGEPCRYATAFAYAEFSCDRREEVFVSLDAAGAVKAWLNGGEIISAGGAESETEKSGTGWVKHGKNTLLLKYSKGPGPYTLLATVEPVSTAPLAINWWK